MFALRSIAAATRNSGSFAMNWSSYFASSSYATIGTGPAVGTNSFSFECWFKLDSAWSQETALIGTSNTTGGNNGFNVRLKTATSIALDAYNATGWNFTVPTITAGVWHHVAVVRLGTTATVFYDGTRSSTGTQVVSQSFANPTMLGANAGATMILGGYLSNVRLITGTTAYDPSLTSIPVPTFTLSNLSGTVLNAFNSSAGTDTSASPFTITHVGTRSIQNVGPFTPASNDQYWSSTTFMLTGDGASIADVSSVPISLTMVGSPALSSSIKKYGAGAVNVPGQGNYIYTPTTGEFGFGLNNFTAEAWVNLNSNTGFAAIFDFRTLNGADNQTKPFLYFNGTTVVVYVQGANRISTASGITLGTAGSAGFYHVALVRNAGTTTVYINGTSKGSFADTFDYGTTSNLIIGTVANAPGSAGWNINGYLDDYRISRNYARYTGNFTPPAQLATSL